MVKAGAAGGSGSGLRDPATAAVVTSPDGSGFTYASDGRKKLAVVSHERSGTHFLMNSMAGHFGYVAKPWWNFDFELPIHFHRQDHVFGYWRSLHNRPVLNILKSHHPVAFFEGLLRYFTEQFHVLYIYRDPRDTLVSHWKLIRSFPWDEGPKTDSAGEFIRAEPRGGMLRYQKRQERNMVQRWRTHVEGWLEAAARHPELPVRMVRYEDLDAQFHETVAAIARFTGLPARVATKPSLSENVVGAGEGGSGRYHAHLSEDDLAFVADEIGDFMRELDYDP